MTAPRLVAKNVHVRLGAHAALAGVDVDIAPGIFTIVVGPNGAGKTTLLRALAGLLTPYEGAITIDGQSLGTISASARARTIAYLPQGGSVAWPIPVVSVVALGRMPHGERIDALPEGGRRAVAAAIEAVGLREFGERPATELSGGERARVLVARALATEAPILLADEPVAALDPRHQLVALEILRARARHAAVVAVMHDLALAARFADRILLMREGRIAAAGAPRDVLTPERLAASFGIEATITEGDGTVLLTPWRAITSA
jgi:iron complex transport system ATP-binding protein